MVRKFIDCRDVPGVKCTVAIFAESEEELLEASDDGAPDLFTTAEDRSQRLARAYQNRERMMKRA